MAFQLKQKDILGKIGVLHTKSGEIETPHLFPVINPSHQPIPCKAIYEGFGCKAVMTNAYLLRKNYGETDVHRFLEFPGVVATDSGAYQILGYGGVEVSPPEMIRYQEAIGTDIGVILDVPTSSKATRAEAEKTVRETVRRADELSRVKARDDVLWMGPIQGGVHLDLLEASAREMAKRDFPIYAIGSPTTVMEGYDFPRLVEMIMTVKAALPIGKPIHLFGAGHPMMLALTVGLGCDLFDSASYAIYAREGRYLTESGTLRLEEMEHFPCACRACSGKSPEEVRNLSPDERTAFLATHNLQSCLQEIARIKEAIRGGRLWELMETRSRAHPRLRDAMIVLERYGDLLERHSPSIKGRGIFYFDHVSLLRPEVLRHKKRLRERYVRPVGKSVLLLIPQPRPKPYHETELVKALLKSIPSRYHLCLYGHPFGVTPVEIDDVYPLSQYEASSPDRETMLAVTRAVEEYVSGHDYSQVALVDVKGSGLSWTKLRGHCRRKRVKFRLLRIRSRTLDGKAVKEQLLKHLRKSANPA